ncbi:MAG: HEPN domain-containing protein [Desulfuromonadaceae bacterium]
MKKDTEIWLKYAEENIRSAEVLLESGIYNPSLQNSQQAIEKLLKAVLIEKATGVTRTHNIRELVGCLEKINIQTAITDDDIDLIDSIYLPSKYPAFSVLPYFMPDEVICRHCLSVARDVYQSVITAIR